MRRLIGEARGTVPSDRNAVRAGPRQAFEAELSRTDRQLVRLLDTLETFLPGHGLGDDPPVRGHLDLSDRPYLADVLEPADATDRPRTNDRRGRKSSLGISAAIHVGQAILGEDATADQLANLTGVNRTTIAQRRLRSKARNPRGRAK